MKHMNFFGLVLLVSLFLVMLSFAGYAACVQSSIVCNETNNDTWPCLSANATFNYTYYYIDCSETMGVGFLGGSTAPTSSQYAPGRNYTFSIVITALENLETVYFESNYTTNASQSGTLYNYTYPNVTNSSDTFTIVLTDLPVQSFVYKWIAINGTHYGATDVLDFEITKADNPAYLYLNGTANNTTYTYPQSVNATATSAGGTVFLYRNGTHIANGTTTQSELIRFGNGTYTYTVNATGNANYTDNATGVTYYAFVNKGTLNLTLNFSPSSTVTYANQTIATGTEYNIGDEDVVYELRRDGGLVSNGNFTGNDSSSVNETFTLPVGTYNYTFNSTGGANWTANATGATAILTVQTGSTGGFVSSSSGVDTTTPTTSVSRKTGNANISINSMSSGDTVNATIAKTDDMAIRRISVSVRNSANDIMIRITKMAGMPSSISHEIDGKTYHYISIEKDNIQDADINRTVIRFAVNRTWMSDNGIDSSDISMYRWESDRWNELPTTYAGNDSFEHFYEAVSPGFSTFVIGTSGGSVEPETLACAESWSCTEWSECSDGLQTRTCTDANACGTTADKPAESQACEAAAAMPPGGENFPFFEVIAVAVLIVLLIIFVLLEVTGHIKLSMIKELFKKEKKEPAKTYKYTYYNDEKDAEDS